MKDLKVSSKSVPSSVAAAVTAIMKTDETLEVFTIGAGALNQAVKAIAIARGYLVPSGIYICCVPEFCLTEVDGEERTALKLIVMRTDHSK